LIENSETCFPVSKLYIISVQIKKRKICFCYQSLTTINVDSVRKTCKKAKHNSCKAAAKINHETYRWQGVIRVKLWAYCVKLFFQLL